MLLSTQGPFPPPALPGFSGTTDPSATLTARPAPRGVPVDVCRISPRASRVAAFFPFHACQRHYPDGSGSVPASLSSPSANGLPLKTGGSASVLSVSRPARRSLAFRPACSLSRPWRPLTPECFRPFRYLHDPPWLLPTGATVVGRGSHPPEEGAFPRRTVSSWITLFLFSFVSDKASDLGAIFGFLGRTGLRGLALSALCCRRLRGSTWSYRFPWAYAHGYLLPPLRGSIGRPGVRPGIIKYQ